MSGSQREALFQGHYSPATHNQSHPPPDGDTSAASDDTSTTPLPLTVHGLIPIRSTGEVRTGTQDAHRRDERDSGHVSDLGDHTITALCPDAPGPLVSLSVFNPCADTTTYARHHLDLADNAAPVIRQAVSHRQQPQLPKGAAVPPFDEQNPELRCSYELHGLAATEDPSFAMTIAPEHLDVVVGEDGAVRVPAPEVARLGARPGEHLHLVLVPPGAARVRRGHRKVRGILVGKIDPADLLTEQDFDDARKARVDAVERKYGPAE